MAHMRKSIAATLGVAIATLATASVTPAAQAAPIPGASYGGGVPPLSYANRHVPRSLHVDAHVTPDGTRGRVRVYGFVRCRGGGWFAHRFDASGPIDAGGRLVARARSLRYRGPGSVHFGPKGIGFADLVFNGTRVTGNVRIRVTVRVKGRRVRCTSGTRPVELRSVAADPGTPAGPTASGLYLGTTESAWRGRVAPISFQVNKAGTRIPSAIWGATISCPGAQEYLANISPSMKIRSDGTFSRTERFTSRFSNATDRVRVIFRGRFTAAGATGTINIRQRTRFRNGARMTCRSGTIRWHAVR